MKIINIMFSGFGQLLFLLWAMIFGAIAFAYNLSLFAWLFWICLIGFCIPIFYVWVVKPLKWLFGKK